MEHIVKSICNAYEKRLLLGEVSATYFTAYVKREINTLIFLKGVSETFAIFW